MITFYLSLIDNKSNNDYFIKIYNKFQNYMYNIAMSYTHDSHYAEDALQVAFTGIAKNIDIIKNLDEEKLEIYILKVARNSAVTVLRNEMTDESNLVDLEKQSYQIDHNCDIVKNAIDSELLNDIFKFINSMKTKYRDILTLYFLYDLNFRQISIALNQPISTVKDRFRKGQKLVIEKFKEHRQNDRL